MEDGKLVKIRTGVLLAIFAAILGAFFFVLYDTQIAHGQDYLDRAFYSVAQTETVEASRGEILDSYGRVLVSNTTQYQVTLDTSLMGAAEERNGILSQLLEICRAQEVTWTDTLPISADAPYSYTWDDATSGQVNNLTKLCALLEIDEGTVTVIPGETDPETGETAADTELWRPTLTSQQLLDALGEEFQVDSTLPETERRDLIGVLYELTLRSREVTYTEYVFASNVDIQFITLVKERKLNGVSIDTVAQRQYQTTYASHILGYTGAIDSEEWEGDEDTPGYRELGYAYNARVGKTGVEKAFESYLHGTSGTREIETDSTGKIINATWREGEEPQPGDNVVLTLDIRLQEAVENLLAAHVESLDESDNAAAVVVDMTGGVLALASYPGYDLSRISESGYLAQLNSDPLTPMVNFATQGLYMPGSIFKPVTAIAGLEEGIITPTTRIRDTGAYTYYTNDMRLAPKCWIYRQYGSTHGLLNVTQAIEVSCNVFFYDVGRRVGISKLNEYAHKFGLGEYTGIEIYEEKGYVAGPDTSSVLGTEWYEGATLSAAIGQENNLFTPLQLANYIATLVNGGTHYSAHLLKSVKSSDYSSVVYEYEPQVLDEIDIDPANLEAVKLGMYEVTQSSSVAPYFNALPVKAGAKTGTAQVNNNTGTNATFVCFAPYDDPQIALCLVVEKGSSGSSLAQLAAEILQFYFSSEETISTVTGENQLMR